MVLIIKLIGTPMIKFKPSYLPSTIEIHQQALTQNVQDDIMTTDEFKALMPKLSIVDSGVQVLFAYALVDNCVSQMKEHNATNYDALVFEAVTAVNIIDEEVERIASSTVEKLDASTAMKPVMQAAHFLLNKHPIHKFCEQRNEKDLMQRVTELVESWHMAIVKACEKQAQVALH